MSHENKLVSKRAQSIQQILAEKGLHFEVIELSTSTRTAIDAARAIGCDVAQIMKSLLFCTEISKQPVLVLASGINRVNELNIAQWVGEKIRKADAHFTREVTGFAIGGVPPVGHKQTIRHIFIDIDLLNHNVLWAAAGTPNAVFSLSASDIESLTHGKIIAIR
ncbi:YbaK/EbsC family protein [Legionella sp. W05-934-2]|jgi:prolyl-tRNA editing enzyme YbaK/EbsC (Cys-tRNA(Pro) deacylase)|uniref:YbaK/EbsC family protein n=1 Tax=Legionella sp. W05-934-2 TaxID=1198649 RepID=UPI0034637ACE